MTKLSPFEKSLKADGARSPKAVGGAIGKRKMGIKKLEAKAQAGRKKSHKHQGRPKGAKNKPK